MNWFGKKKKDSKGKSKPRSAPPARQHPAQYQPKPKKPVHAPKPPNKPVISAAYPKRHQHPAQQHHHQNKRYNQNRSHHQSPQKQKPITTRPKAQTHGLAIKGNRTKTAEINEAKAANTLTCPTRRIISGAIRLAPKKPTK